MKKLITRETAVCFGKSIFAASIIILGGVFSPVMAQRSRSLSAQLVGTWRFESATQRMADGTVCPDPQTGPNGKGYIIYTETGQMCAMIANPDRTKWKSEAAPQEDELRNAFAGLVADGGTYEVNEKEKHILHHIEFNRVPNLAGKFTGRRQGVGSHPDAGQEMSLKARAERAIIRIRGCEIEQKRDKKRRKWNEMVVAAPINGVFFSPGRD